MSTLKTNNAQIGQSATANQNFTLYQPSVPDGTVRLGVGNSGATTADAVTVTNAGNATLLGNLTVSGTGTSTFAGTLNATTALQSGGVATGRIVQGTAQATTSGTAVGFTGLPTWVKRITMQLIGVYNNNGSVSTTNLIQVGSGSYTTTGYISAYSNVNASSAGTGTISTGFTPYWGYTAVTAVYGQIILTLQNPSTNTWAASGWFTTTYTPSTCTANGSIALSGALDRIQLTATSGTFAGGSVNIIYEG